MKMALWLTALTALLAATDARAVEWDTYTPATEPAGAACTGGFARTVPASVAGLISTRLTGDPRGSDWDLRLVDERTGVERDASNAFGGAELAITDVAAGDRLRAEACPGAGVTGVAPALIVSETVPDGPVTLARESLVRIAISGRSDLPALAALGIDLNEAAEGDHVDAVLHGAGDAARLRDAGYDYDVRVADLRAADRRALRTPAARRALPSGRTSYRHLSDYQKELKDLVAAHPDLVRPVVIGTSVLGQSIEGVEIATGVSRTDDGRPVHVEMGLHHAREWSSGEMVMEFARELAADPGARFQALRDTTRTFLFPVINPDGFDATMPGGADYNPLDDSFEATLGLALAGTGSYRRKNCAGSTGACTSAGIDLNRNYGAFWGGPGNSDNPAMQDYRGPAPFSEPEAAAVHAFSSAHQIMLLNSNHNYAGDVLYQPGFNDSDEPGLKTTDKVPYQDEMKAVAEAMAAAAGYEAFPSYDLYDVTGATEDWNYFAQGAFGYTVEVGYDNFHPNYQDAVVDQYTGTRTGTLDAAADPPRPAAKGIRETLLIAGEAVANPAYHSIIRGTAPAGRLLRIRKSFKLSTSFVITNTDTTADVGEAQLLDETLESTLTVPAGGSYEWHVNPSTRPLELLAGRTEAWTLTCESADGKTVYDTRQVTVGIGKAVTEDLPCAGSTPDATATATGTATPTGTGTGTGTAAAATATPTATTTATASPAAAPAVAPVASLRIVKAIQRGRRLVVRLRARHTGAVRRVRAALRTTGGRRLAAARKPTVRHRRFRIVLRTTRPLASGRYRIRVSARTSEGRLVARAGLRIRPPT